MKFDEDGVLLRNTGVAVVVPLCVAGGTDWLEHGRVVEMGAGWEVALGIFRLLMSNLVSTAVIKEYTMSDFLCKPSPNPLSFSHHIELHLI